VGAAIQATGLSKRYVLGTRRVGYETLRDRIAGAFTWARRNSEDARFIWALRDVSLEVSRGEVVGIIGRNGAGKSTLLKILAGITEPTYGRAAVRGRVASMLEVGTGFHPELTGRENTLLNGVILGMTRREVVRRFDEIVAFAGIEKFIDTPVKHYSTGMYLRLAFAVAAHLDTEILFVDEVLAVGDAEFQRKCLGKMKEVGSSGRTVLFVSHSIPTVLRLCGRVLLLEGGALVGDGSPHEIAGRYLHPLSGSSAERVWPSPSDAPGDSVARLRAVRVTDQHGQLAATIDITEGVILEGEYWNLEPSLKVTMCFWVMNEDGTCVFCTADFNNLAWWNSPRERGVVRARCRIPGNFLGEGRFFVLAALSTYDPDIVHCNEPDAVTFQVLESASGGSVRGPYSRDWPGIVRPMLEWDISMLAGDKGDGFIVCGR
jgi:lipopolysaccharide transport system ATP-binding protein